MEHSAFWNRIADSYAARPVANPTAYEQTLSRTRSYLRATDQVLEVGCGTGSTALALSSDVAHYTATDISPRMVAIAQDKAAKSGAENVIFRTAVSEEPLDTTHYDAVIAMNLLHLVEDVPGTVATLADRLKPGGYLITKTACLADRQWFLRPVIAVMQAIGKAPRPVKFIRASELERIFVRAGMKVVEAEDHGVRFIVARKP